MIKTPVAGESNVVFVNNIDCFFEVAIKSFSWSASTHNYITCCISHDNISSDVEGQRF